MPRLSLTLDTGAYQSPNVSLIQREATNLYVLNPAAEGAVARGALVTMPGSTKLADLDLDFVSATHVYLSELYVYGVKTVGAVEYNRLYKIASDGTVTLISSNTDGNSGGVAMADNGVVMCVLVPGFGLYFYDATNGFVKSTDATVQSYEAEAGGIRSLKFLDGYFVFCTYTKLFISSLVTVNDGKNFDALDFLTPFLREKSLKLLVVRGELLVFGESNSKFYANVGGADFPFQEIPGAAISKGVVINPPASLSFSATEPNNDSAIEFDNSYFFIGSGNGETLGIWRGVGGGAVSKISTDFIDRFLDPYATVTVLGAPIVYSVTFSIFGFMHEGRPFIAVNSSSRGTYVFDILASTARGQPVWSKWTDSGVVSGPTWTYAQEVYGQLCGVVGLNEVHILDSTVSTFEGQDPKTFRFISQYVDNQSLGICINRVELHCSVGVGTDPGVTITDNDPTVLLEYSNDGGQTWLDAGTQSLGRFQKYDTSLSWRRLGRAASSVIFRFTCTASIPLQFNKAEVDITPTFRNA